MMILSQTVKIERCGMECLQATAESSNCKSDFTTFGSILVAASEPEVNKPARKYGTASECPPRISWNHGFQPSGALPKNQFAPPAIHISRSCWWECSASSLPNSVLQQGQMW